MLKVLLRECKLFRRHRLLWGAVILICFVPAIYSFTYLSSFWDPFGQLEKLPVGVVSLDKGADADDHHINIGSMFIKTIKEKKLFAFIDYETREQAENAVRSGETYFSVVVPADFSAKAVPGKDVGVFDIIASPGSSYTAMMIAQKFADRMSETLNHQLNAQRWNIALESLKKEKAGIEKLMAGNKRIHDGLAELQKGLEKAAKGTWQVYDGQVKMTAGIGSINTEMLVSKGKELHEATEKIATGLSKSGVLSAITSLPSSGDLRKLAEGAKLYQLKIEELAAGINKAVKGSEKLSEGEKKIVAGTEVMKHGTEELLKGAGKISDGLKGFLEAIPDLDFDPDDLATSIKFNIIDLNAATSNGEAFAPYFMALSLWVGMMVLSYIFRYNVYAESVSDASFISKVAGKDAIPLTVCLISSIVLGLTINAMVRVPLIHLFGFYLVLLIAAFTYCCFILGVIRIFGDTGKIIILLFLVVQISSAGGVYPIELSSTFYQRISPYLPMTIVVKSLRAAMFDSFDGQWLRYCLRLVPWMLMGLIMTVIGKRRFETVPDEEYSLAIVLPVSQED
ncbi:MAG: YhgE/Pip domain-containing protein [Phycisphaerae bacterium]|nr:YhgE/Pip domain-containing protein [Phycisphaerae bacterium]